MKRTPRPMLCLPLLAAGACSADAIAGPAPRAEAEAVEAQPEATPVLTFRCGRWFSVPPGPPLYIIDGAVGTEAAAVALIGANAIGEIEVVKGADAAPVYGSRAAAGVVIITTLPPRPEAVRQTTSRRGAP